MYISTYSAAVLRGSLLAVLLQRIRGFTTMRYTNSHYIVIVIAFCQ